MNKTYQVSKKGIEGLLAGTVLAIVVFALIWPPVGVIFTALVVGAIIVAVVLRKEYTHSVVIDAENRSVTFITKSRTSTKTDVIKFDEISFIYKKRLDYYSFTNGYLKEKRNILLTNSELKTLAFLVPEQDGWTNAIILDLAKTFSELGIKQIVEKYNDDEIPL